MIDGPMGFDNRTGLYVRAFVDGEWQSVDIADRRLTNAELLAWLRSRGGANRWAENVVGHLLGRGPLHPHLEDSA